VPPTLESDIQFIKVTAETPIWADIAGLADIENPEPDRVKTFPPEDGPTLRNIESNLGALNENTRNILSFLPSIETIASRKMFIPLLTLQKIDDSLDQKDLLHPVPPTRASTVGKAIP
jgi:hypothetical protein